MIPVEWSPRALRALFDIYDLHPIDNPEAAARVIDRVRFGAGLLADQPMLGRASELRNRRELIVDQYVITYQARRERIWILFLEHGSRRR